MGAPLRILLEDHEGHQKALPFSDGAVIVGRDPESALFLGDRNVSRRHARFSRQNGSVYVEDLGSANGTRVNGERVEGRRRLRPGDLVQIGDWDLALEGALEEATPERPLTPPPLPAQRAEGRAAPTGASASLGLAPSDWRRAAALVAAGLLATAAGYAAGKALRAAPPARPSVAETAHLP